MIKLGRIDRYIDWLEWFLWRDSYFAIFILLLVLGILFSFLAYLRKSAILAGIPDFLRGKVIKKHGVLAYKSIYFIVFFPLVLIPIYRCYFKIPFIYCNNCPTLCVWGPARVYLISLILVINLNNRFWCYRFCPLGIYHDLYRNRVALPDRATNIRWPILIFVIMATFGFLWFFFAKMVLSISYWVLAIAGLLALVAALSHRFWCKFFCPIGAFSDLILKLQEVVKKGRGHLG